MIGTVAGEGAFRAVFLGNLLPETYVAGHRLLHALNRKPALRLLAIYDAIPHSPAP